MQTLIEVNHSTIEATEVNLTIPQQGNFAQNYFHRVFHLRSRHPFHIDLPNLYFRQQINDITYYKASGLQSSQV